MLVFAWELRLYEPMESGGFLILLGLDFLVFFRVVNELGEFLVVFVFVLAITDAAEYALALNFAE